MASLLSLIEDMLDTTDGVRRRRLADTIYRDLQAERISVDAAIEELRKLNKRQKGGWLYLALSEWLPRRKSPQPIENPVDPVTPKPSSEAGTTASQPESISIVP